jgi:hypothetical protein
MLVDAGQGEGGVIYDVTMHELDAKIQVEVRLH